MRQLIVKLRHFLFTLSLFFPICSLAIESNPFVSFNVIADQPTGIVYAIKVIDGKIYLGSDNGIFLIEGDKSFHFSSTFLGEAAPVVDVVISDDSMIFGAIYGNGLMMVDKIGQKPINLNESDGLITKYVTKLEFIDKHLLFISSVFGLQLYNTQLKQFINLEDYVSGYINSELDSNFVKVSDLSFITLDSENCFVIDFKARVAKHCDLPSELKAKRYSKIKYFDNSLWLLAENEVISFNLSTKEIRNFGINTPNNVEPYDIHQLNESSFLIASEGLYKINLDENEIVKSNLMAPFLSNGTLAVIDEFAVSNTGQILLGGPVFGFTWLPSTINSINYLSYREQSIKGKLQRIITDTKRGFLVLLSGSLYTVDDIESGELLWITDTSIPPLTSIVKRDQEVFGLSNDGDVLIIGTSQLHKQLDSNHNFSKLVSFSGKVLGLSTNNKILEFTDTAWENIEITGFSPNALFASEDAVIAIEYFRSAYISFDSKEWVKLDHKNIQDTISIECVERSINGTYYFCSSGDGILTLQPESLTLVHSKLNSAIDSKYIRAIKSDGYGHLWIATNSGLYRADSDGKWVQKLTQKEGIIDVDFEFEGLYTDEAKDRLFVVGDKLTSVIELSSFNQVLDRYLEDESRVFITNIRNFSGTGEDSGYQATQKFREEKPQYVIENDVYLTEINFAAQDAIAHRYLDFEYRLLGLDDSWRKAKKGNAAASFSTLPFGDYVFQARAIDQQSLKEQPITSVQLKVLPPVWLTLNAFVVYFLLLITIYLLSKLWQRNLAFSKKAEIDGLVHEKTYTLTEENKALLKQLDNSKTLFSSLSHEIRTPLTIITGWLNHLKQNSKLDPVTYKLDAMYQNSNRLKILVDQLLELERVGEHSSAKTQVYNVFKSLVLIVESFKPLTSEKFLQVSLRGKRNLNVAMVKGAFDKIFTNIISNAIKYSPSESTIDIYIREKGDFVEISIADSGDGIPENELSEIFERFSRLQQHEGLTGSGIGLALVKELTKASYGEIEVSSEIGAGTTFTLRFPIIRDGSPEKAEALDKTLVEFESAKIRDLSQSSESDSSFEKIIEDKRKTVLIIDDSEEIRELIYQILSLEFNCLRAINGKEGFEIATNMLPDAIVSDVVMPGIDGVALTKKIREQDITSHIPIILVSAKGEDDSKITGLTAKADDYLVKPFNEQELLLKVRQHISALEKVANVKQDEHEDTISSVDLLKVELPKFENERDQRFYSTLLVTTNKHYHEDSYSREVAAAALNCTDRQLNRKLNALVDLNFTNFLKKFRLQQAKKLLKERGKVGDVAYDVGFTSPSYFGSCFKNEFGETPKEFIERIQKIDKNSSNSE